MELKKRIWAIEALKVMVSIYSHKEIAKMFNISKPVLSRYVNGHVLPKPERAEEILRLFREKYLREAVRRKVKVSNGVIDVMELLSNVRLLNHIALDVAYSFDYIEVNRILTKEVDGVPLAVLVSNALGADLIVAKGRKEPGIEKFYEIRQTYSSGIYRYIYIPRKLLKPRDKVLIIDDVARSGSTIMALVDAVRMAKAKPIGVYVIVSLNDVVEKLSSVYKFPIKSLIKIGEAV